MNILLLGGTGAIGKPCTEYLLDKGFEVYITSRRKRESRGNCHFIEGNAKDYEFISSILKKEWDCIVDFMNYSTSMFESRVEMLLASTKHYIFISSSRVYSSLDDIITEETPRLLDVINDKEYLKTDEYALHKAREENLLFNSGKNNWTIVRPYISYNTYRLQLGVTELPNWLFRALQGRTIVFSNDIASKYTTLTYGGNVAEGIASLVGHEKTFGEAYHITCNESILWRDVLNIYLDEIENYLGCKPDVKWTDKALNLQISEAKYQVMYDRCYDRKFDTSKISQFINVNNFLTPQEGLRNCIRQFLSNPSFCPPNTTYEAMQDKLCHEFTSLSNYQSIRQKVAYVYKRIFI